MAIEKKSLISKSTTPSTKNIKAAPVAGPKLQTAVQLAKPAQFAKQIKLAKQVTLAKKVTLAKQVTLAKKAII